MKVLKNLKTDLNKYAGDIADDMLKSKLSFIKDLILIICIAGALILLFLGILALFFMQIYIGIPTQEIIIDSITIVIAFSILTLIGKNVFIDAFFIYREKKRALKKNATIQESND